MSDDSEDDPIDDLVSDLEEAESILDDMPETYPLLKEHTGYSNEFNTWFLAYDSALRGLREGSILPEMGTIGEEVKGPEDVVEPPAVEDMSMDLSTGFSDMVEEGLAGAYDVALDAAEAALEANMEAREAASKESGEAEEFYNESLELLSDAVTAANAFFSSYEHYFEEVREELGEVITPEDDISVRRNLRRAERNFEKFSTFYANEVIHAIQSELRETAEEYIGDEELINEAYKAGENIRS